MLAPLTLPAAPADRFARLIEVLCRALAARGGRGLAGPLIILLWSRLRRTAVRFASLAARVRAGRLPANAAATRSGKSGPPPPNLPKSRGWLVRLMPEAAASASQLQHLLADPEMAALLAAAPQAGRLLRPLCRMLGVGLPPALRLPPRPKQPAPPAAPSQGSTGEPDPPPAQRPEPRPPWHRSGAGWVPRSRLFVWHPPHPA